MAGVGWTLVAVWVVLVSCLVVGGDAQGAGGGRRVLDDVAIDQLSLLLPLTHGKVKTSYILKAYNGCFKWYVNLYPIYSLYALLCVG